jgi:hypothetical protein
MKLNTWISSTRIHICHYCHYSLISHILQEYVQYRGWKSRRFGSYRVFAAWRRVGLVTKVARKETVQTSWPPRSPNLTPMGFPCGTSSVMSPPASRTKEQWGADDLGFTSQSERRRPWQLNCQSASVQPYTQHAPHNLGMFPIMFCSCHIRELCLTLTSQANDTARETEKESENIRKTYYVKTTNSFARQNSQFHSTFTNKVRRKCRYRAPGRN